MTVGYDPVPAVGVPDTWSSSPTYEQILMQEGRTTTKQDKTKTGYFSHYCYDDLAADDDEDFIAEIFGVKTMDELLRQMDHKL